MMGSGGLGAVIAEAADNIFDGLSASVLGERPMELEDLPHPDGRRGWRMNLADVDPAHPEVLYSPLTDTTPVGWRPGRLFARCVRDPRHVAPARRCDCGVYWNETPAGALAYWQHHALDFREHVAAGWGPRAADSFAPPEFLARMVLCEVDVLGPALRATPDGPGWHRSMGAQLAAVTVPADLGHLADTIGDYYQVPVVVEDTSGREFIAALAARYGADPTGRGCLLCLDADQRTGREDYPVCKPCDSAFPQLVGSLFGWRPQRTVTGKVRV